MRQLSQLEQRTLTSGVGEEQGASSGLCMCASFGAVFVQASTWRTAEVGDNRSYGRVPEGSLGGAAAPARVRGCELGATLLHTQGSAPVIVMGC